MGVFGWEPLALIGVLSGLLSWTMSAVIYFTRPDLTRNRLLALFLFFAGATWLFFSGIGQFFTDVRLARAAIMTGLATHVFSHFCHLLFLSTLRSPVAAILKPLAVRVLIGFAALVAAWSTVFQAERWVSGIIPWTPGKWEFVAGPYWIDWVFVGLWAFGFLVAVTAAHNPASWSDRAQKRAYLTAFAVHDGGFALAYAWVIIDAPLSPSPWFTGFVVIFAWPLLNIWLTVWLSYGILRTQLFDVDLKVRLAIKGGTLAAIVVGVFFIASELGVLLLQSRTGSAVVGVVAVGLLVMLSHPLQRFAERVAGAAMPNVKNSDEYRTYRKHEVYRAALEGMLKDQQVSAKERAVLDRLRENLAIGNDVAAAMERDVVRAMRVT